MDQPLESSSINLQDLRHNFRDAITVLDLITQLKVFPDAFAIAEKICIQLIRVGAGQLSQTTIPRPDDIRNRRLACPGQA